MCESPLLWGVRQRCGRGCSKVEHDLDDLDERLEWENTGGQSRRLLSNIQLTTPWERVGYVDSRVRQKGWSMKVCAELAQEMGVDPRTVSRYWEKAQRWTRRTLKPQDVETWRASQIQLLDEAARQAKAEGRYADVAALMKVAASITGTNVAVKVEHSGGISMLHATTYVNVPLEALEADVAKLQGMQRQIAEVEPGVALLAAPEVPVPMEQPPVPMALDPRAERAMSRLRKA